MRTATASMHSLSPYSQSGFFKTEREQKEAADHFEARAWRERIHTTDDGRVFIPPMAFKWAIAGAAQMLGKKIPGKRNATYTKHFQAGVLVVEGPVLPVKAKDVEGEWLWLDAGGRRGGGTRVKRCMPVIREWEARVDFHVLDETITKDVFEETLREAGSFVGIGRFRPQNGGYYGRFAVDSVKWSEA